MTFVVLVAFYLLLGVAAYMVPDAPVHHHIEQTLAGGDLSEDYPHAIIYTHPFALDPYTMDNFTDALILNQAELLRSEGLKGILLLPRHDGDIVQTHNLRALMDSGNGYTIHYARYWHGTTFVARILLFFTAYFHIRYLLFFCTTLLMLWCLLRLWNNVGKKSAIALLFALLTANVYVMQFSLQFAPILIIAISGIIWLTYRNGKSPLLPFFVLGSLTAYFDLLTTPTLTLGLPLVAVIAMRRDNNLWHGIRQLIQIGILWGIAYALTWASKWGLATLLTGEDIFANALGEAHVWTNDGQSFIGQALRNSFSFLHWKYIAIALFLLAIMAIVRTRKSGWTSAVLYLLVALIPAAYIIAMAHHTHHHVWFTYRTHITTTAALVMALASMIDWRQLRQLCAKRSRKSKTPTEN